MEQDAVEKCIIVAETMEDISEFIASLPRLGLDQLSSLDFCPICLVAFSSILSESSADKPNGVTKLKCGHIFCLSDISEWIRTPRGSCPTCRDMFLVVPEFSDEESSDGGEYIPGSDLTDDFMDEDYWTEAEDPWTESEAELSESNTWGEPSSSWGSEAQLDEANAPAHGQTISIADSSEEFLLGVIDLTDGLTNEISQLKSSLHSIQPLDFIHRKEQVMETLNDSLAKTKEMKRLLDSQEFSSWSPKFQSMLETLQQIEAMVDDLLAATRDRE